MEQVSSIQRCVHGIYMSAADAASGKSWGCDSCWPDGRPETATPVLPRSSGDTLGRDEGERVKCHACGNLRTYFAKQCRVCGADFPDDDLRGRGQMTANRRQVGECSQCGSAVHYETEKKSVWQCADCMTLFKAPRPRFSDLQ